MVKESGNFLTSECKLSDESGQTLATAVIKYGKYDPQKIANGAVVHEEMCYLNEDGVTELPV